MAKLKKRVHSRKTKKPNCPSVASLKLDYIESCEGHLHCTAQEAFDDSKSLCHYQTQEETIIRALSWQEGMSRLSLEAFAVLNILFRIPAEVIDIGNVPEEKLAGITDEERAIVEDLRAVRMKGDNQYHRRTLIHPIRIELYIARKLGRDAARKIMRELRTFVKNLS